MSTQAIFVPSAPTLTSISCASATANTLTWNAPTSNGGATILFYLICRSTQSNLENAFQPFYTLQVPPSGILTFTDTGLTNGTRYFYKIVAQNTQGIGPLSNELSIITGVPNTCLDVGAKTTNSITMNNVVGSNPNAINNANPLFSIAGDGGLSSYTVAVDGTPYPNTYHSSGDGTTCVQAFGLSDGTHTITGTEVAPHAGNSVGPYSFLVDTAAPVAPVITSATASGSAYIVSGTCVVESPNLAIQVYERLVDGTEQLKGGTSSSGGTWSVTTVALSTGMHTLIAYAIDQAGNRSVASNVVIVPTGFQMGFTFGFV